MKDKRIVTQEDLDNDPELEKSGISVGDECEFDTDCTEDDEQTSFDGPGGTDPDKPRPPKPPVG